MNCRQINGSSGVPKITDTHLILPASGRRRRRQQAAAGRALVVVPHKSVPGPLLLAQQQCGNLELEPALPRRQVRCTCASTRPAKNKNTHVAQLLQVHEILPEPYVSPDALLHAQRQRPVLPVDVDGRDLVLHGPAPGLKPRHERLVALQQVHHALGARVLQMLPGLAAKHDVHARHVKHLWRLDGWQNGALDGAAAAAALAGARHIFHHNPGSSPCACLRAAQTKERERQGHSLLPLLLPEM